MTATPSAARPFPAWGGVYHLGYGDYELLLSASARVAVLPVAGAERGSVEWAAHEVAGGASRDFVPGDPVPLDGSSVRLTAGRYMLSPPEPGHVALFLDQEPGDVGLALSGPAGPQSPAVSHTFR